MAIFREEKGVLTDVHDTSDKATWDFGDGQERTTFLAIPIASLLYVSEIPFTCLLKNDKVGMAGVEWREGSTVTKTLQIYSLYKS